jgi:hypothetical protein
MKQCDFCGREYYGKSGRITRFCSRNCSAQSVRKNFPKHCASCGVEFLAPRSHPKQKCCSTKCRDDIRRVVITQPCDQCGKPVTRQRLRALGLKHAFCNRECNRAWKITHAPRGVAHHQYKERETFTCEVCGKPFTRLASQMRQHKFCSESCRVIWQQESGYTTGEKSATWKGGYTFYYGPNWYSQRRKARQRDEYTCQMCGKLENTMPRQLDVHHVRPFREFGIENYREANRLSNLICYCNVCHSIVERSEKYEEAVNEYNI